MLQARIEMDNGIVFHLGNNHGSWFDISPLTSADVSIATSQGFQQRGVTVSSTSVGGVSRELSGTFIGQTARQDAVQLCKALAPLSSGRLYIGDTAYAEIVVEKSPELVYLSHDCIDFSAMLFSPSPDYFAVDSVSVTTGGYVAEFSYPTALGAHRFASLSGNTATIMNPGDVAARYRVRFTALQDVDGVKLVNSMSLAKLEINQALTTGDTIDCYWSNNQFKVFKGSTNIFNKLDDDSNMFEIPAGSTVLTTDNDYVVATVELLPVYTIIPEAAL